MTLAGLTIRGRCLLAAGFAAALCGLLLNERDLLRIGVFVVALPLLAVLVCARTWTGLRATRQVLPPRIPVGGKCDVTLSVRSTGWLGGRLRLSDGVPQVLGHQPGFRVDRPTRSGTRQLHYPLCPVQRGVHSIGPLVAQVSDPFGLVAHPRELAGHSRLVVTPVVVPLTTMLTGSGLDAREDGAERRRDGSHTDTIVVRGYRHGDDLRRVHWRLSARHDELMVRVEDQRRRGGSAVLVDHRAVAHRGHGPTSSLEYAMSLAASVCVHLQRCGHRVQLITADGGVLAGGGDAPGEAGHVVLEALAALRPVDRQTLLYDPAVSGEVPVIAVLGAAAPALIEPLLRHRPANRRNHAVLLDVAAWSTSATGDPGAGGIDPAETARLLVAAGWSVAVARPELPVGSVWEQLCINSRNQRGALR